MMSEFGSCNDQPKKNAIHVCNYRIAWLSRHANVCLPEWGGNKMLMRLTNKECGYARPPS